MDYRIEWFRERVLTLFGETDEEIFTELLAQNDGAVRDKLSSFITDDISELCENDKRLVFFYKTSHKKVIQHEIVVAKKQASFDKAAYETKSASDEDSSSDSDHSKSPPVPPAPPSSAAKSKKGSGRKGRGSMQRGSASSETKQSKKSGTGSGKGSKKGRKSPSTVVETVTDVEDVKTDEGEEETTADDVVAPPPPDVTYVTRIDQEVIMQSVLHYHFGGLPEDLQNSSDITFLMFLRHNSEGTRSMDTWEIACAEMPSAFVIASFKSPVIPALYTHFEKVFSPILEGTAESTTMAVDTPFTASRSQSVDSSRPSSLRQEQLSITGLIHEISPLFHSLIRYDESHQKYDLQSETISNIEKVEKGEITEALIKQLETVASGITYDIQITIHDILTKKISGQNPIEEIAYWDEHEADLSALCRKINSSHLSRVHEALAKTQSCEADELREAIAQASTLLARARAITRSLTPTAGYFRELNECSSLVAMRHVLIRLMDNLRMLWILCSPFSKDENMEPLLGRVAWLLCKKVAARLDMDTIFRQGAEKAMTKAKQGSKLLRAWKDLYFQTRQDIEKSGHTPRWEFDCKKLFGDSEYIKEVCIDLMEICKVLIQFRSVLTLELKAVIGNPSTADSLLKKVSQLIAPIQQDADFEVFLSANADSWRSFMNHFRRNVLILEQEICEFFQTALAHGNISSSTDVLNLLQTYTSNETRENLRTIFISKYELVISQFMEEIADVELKFNNGKSAPPIMRFQPPDAGAILWSRSLFNKLKTSVLLLQDVKELQKLPLTSEALEAYVQLTRQMKNYQDQHYESWLKNTEEMIRATVNNNVVKLSKIPKKRKSMTASDRRLGLFVHSDSYNDRSSSESSRLTLRPLLASLRFVARAIAARKRASTASENAIVLPQISLDVKAKSIASQGLKFEIEFNDKLIDTLAEAELMEHLGLELTPFIKRYSVTRITLQTNIKNLRKMSKNFNEIISALDEAEIEVLQSAIKEAELTIEPGVNRLKWTSRSIGEYHKSCEYALSKLRASIEQVKFCSKNAKDSMEIMKTINLFHIDSSKLLPWREYFRHVAEKGQTSMKQIMDIYNRLIAICHTLEHWIDQSTTGRNKFMKKYYEFWEQKFFEAVLSMVIRNLKYFLHKLQSDEVMFVMEAHLQQVTLRLEPPTDEAYQVLVSNVNGMLFEFKKFRRWMNGTCIPCPDPENIRDKNSGKATKLFSFLEDILKIREIKELLSQIKETAGTVLAKTKKSMYRWKKYRMLWSHEKGNTCSIFSKKNPSLILYDEKLLYFSCVIQKLDHSKECVDIGCVRLNLRPLILALKNHAISWRNHLAEAVKIKTKRNTRAFLNKAWLLQIDLDKPVMEDDPESLKIVLKAIIDIRKATTDSEVKACEIQESYRTLTLHDIEVSEVDLKISQQLWCFWDFLYLKSLQKMEDLAPLKNKYANKTKKLVDSLTECCNVFVERFHSSGPGSVQENLEEGLVLMKKYASELETLNNERSGLLEDEILFDIDLADHSELKNISQRMINLQEVYDLYSIQKAARFTWSSTLWVDLSTTTLKDSMNCFIQQFDSMSSEAQELDVAQHLKNDMNDFINSIPLFESLKNEALRLRHWQQLTNKAGKVVDINPESFTLQSLIHLELHKYVNETENIVLCATKELVIENALLDIRKSWADKEFTFIKNVRNGNGTGYLLGCVDEITQQIDNQKMILKQLFTSKYVGPFLESVRELEITLATVDEVLSAWMKVQDKWTNLEYLFRDSNIVAQLTVKTVKKFEHCDKLYSLLMGETTKNPLVVVSCCRQGFLKQLIELTVALENCQAALAQFLTSKRQVFPRLNFITDEELLTLIGGDVSQSINSEIRKLKIFPNISRLELSEGHNGQAIITAVISKEGEVITLKNPVDTARLNIESWLNILVNELHNTIKYKIKFAIHDYGHSNLPQCEWIHKFLGMVTIATLNTWWTVKAEDVLHKVKNGNSRAMKEYFQEIDTLIVDIISEIHKTESNIESTKLRAALLLHIQFKNIIENLIYNGVYCIDDYLWKSQLRYYWLKSDDSLFIHQCCSEIEFGYEYTGLYEKLISTPQTDRIVLVITQALSMQLGIMLSGKSGIGKTETVRETARMLGYICLVTDCNANMSCKNIGKFLAGLAQSGLWGCLEQLDRLESSTLSVLSSQLHTIRSAKLMRLSSFSFNDEEICLNMSTAIFGSINPNVDGRHELPQSLRMLFRPAACTLPDLEHISFVALIAQGFKNAKVLAKKINKLCNFCHEKLSQQNHYYFGVFQVMCIIKLAAKLKEENKSLSEESIIVLTLTNTILPKLVKKDVDLFIDLLKNMFPRVEAPQLYNKMFQDAVVEVMNEKGFMIIPNQIDKIVQLNEALDFHSAVILIGDTGGGKSVISQTLALAEEKNGTPNKFIILGPKTCSSSEFFGTIKNEEWKEGIFSKIFRNVNKPKNEISKYYFVFDGHIDALWVENLNSLLDDNKLMTLVNGDRIPLQTKCCFIFEAGNLNASSPSILSRACVIYVSPDDMGHYPTWCRWMKNHDELQRHLDELYNKFVPQILENIDKQNMTRILNFSNMNMINQLCYILDALILNSSNINENLTCIFIQALYVSFGAMIAEENRNDFDKIVKEISGCEIIEDSLTNPAKYGQLPEKTLFEYFWDADEKLWKNWSWCRGSYAHIVGKPLEDVMVPTPQTVQNCWLLNKVTEIFFCGLVFQKIQRPLVFVGDCGSTKTTTIQSYLRDLDLSIYLQQSLTLSSRTSSAKVQSVIESAMKKRTKDVLVPLHGKKLIVFLDDLNMPIADVCGTQEPNEFLRLLFEHGGLYDREEDKNWRQLKDIGFVGAITTANGNGSKLDPRFLSQLCMINLPRPSGSTLQYIFSQILRGHLQTFPGEVQQLADSMVAASLHLFELLCDALPPTPARWMCHLGIRDLTRLFGGLCLTQPEHFSRPETLIRVWRHEIYRVFCDRLETEKDLTLANTLLEDTLQRFYTPYAEHALRNPILFGDFRNALNENETRWYEDLLDFEAIFFLFQEVLEELNRRGEGPKLDLVLFDSALEHLARLHRVLRMFRGHAVLIGGPGVGRKSLTRLAACTAHCCLQELPHTGTSNNLKKALQNIFVFLGVRKKSVALIITDSDLRRREIPEMVHHMLSTGWIPGLFSNEDKEEIISQIINCDDASIDRERVWLQFQTNCVQRLHVVLIISKHILQVHSQIYPSLLTQTMLDWFHTWPEEALQKVAKYFLANEPIIPEICRDAVQEVSVWIHTSASAYYEQVKQVQTIPSSPRLYLDFVKSYLALLTENIAKNKKEHEQLASGLSRISQARGLLQQLGTRLAERESLVLKHKTVCQELLQQIEQVSARAEQKRILAAEWSCNAERQERILSSEQIQVQQIFNTVQPALEIARAGLVNLEESDICAISMMDAPPDQLRILCECILLLQGLREIPWDNARVMVGSIDHIHQLSELPCDSISHTNLRIIKVQLKKAKNLENISKISNVGAAFLKFIKAILEYCSVLREVKPRLEVVWHLETELQQSQDAATMLLSEVSSEEQVLSEVQSRHATITQELHSMQEEAETMHKHLASAKNLFSSLDSEECRWINKSAEVENAMIKLPGDCLLTAAMLSYAGPLSAPGLRREALHQWTLHLESLEIPVTKPFQPQPQLVSSEDKSSLLSCIMDEATLQNITLMTNAVRYPLCIDPQQQALEWVKTMEKDLKVTSTNDPDLLLQLEEALDLGLPVLLQDIGKNIESVFYNLLDKTILQIEDELYVNFGDKRVKFNPNFRLYLNTRDSIPQFSPVLYTKTTVIDCTITALALESRLLSDVIVAENPEIQQQFESMASQRDTDVRLMHSLEQVLLTRLSEAAADCLLEDPQLLVNLESTKLKITQLSQEITDISDQQLALESSRQEYQSVSRRAALLFSVLADLAHIAPTYHFSLDSFRNVLKVSIEQVQAKEESSQRLEMIVDTLTRNTHSFVCRGLFTQHQLSFTLTLLMRIQLSHDEISHYEVNFLTSNYEDTNQDEVTPEDMPQWMTLHEYKRAAQLAAISPEIFGEFLEDLKSVAWETWVKTACPETTAPPSGYNDKLSLFQRLLLLKCLRQDRVIPAIQNYIQEFMGEHFITPIIPSMRSLLKESSASVPVLLLLSNGADPATELQRLSRQCGRDSGQFISLAVGESQEIAAASILQNAVRRGQWLLLLNCHLAPRVPGIVWRLLERSTPHPDFRLWLTSDATPHLPPSLLHTALKVVLEVPKGLKLKLNNTFRKLEVETVNKCRHPQFMRIMYVLAHLHATLQERVGYGTIGWNADYNFSKSDFDASTSFLADILNNMKGKIVPWSSIQALVGQVVYGGHINDIYDQQIVSTYLQEFCGDFIFHDKFNFYQDDNIAYSLPSLLNTFGILAHIQSLPLGNSCVVIGLHRNAEIRHNRLALQQMINYMSQLQPQQERAIIGFSREDVALKSITEILSQLPATLASSELLRRSGTSGPSLSFILQELDAFNGLLDSIKTSLDRLKEALLGKASMDDELTELLTSLNDGAVPQTWRKLCPPTSETLQAWVQLLRLRYNQYYDWIMKHEPLVVWLPGLHAPRCFLLSLLQTACHKHHWALEQAALRLTVCSLKHLPAVQDGTYIRGLHLENASWDIEKGCLKASEIGELTVPFPVVSVVAVEKQPDRLTNCVRTPLYWTRRQGKEKRNPLWELQLSCCEHPSTWLLQGVRLLLDPH